MLLSPFPVYLQAIKVDGVRVIMVHGGNRKRDLMMLHVNEREIMNLLILM